MTNRRYNIPTTGSMIAFESSARHLNFTRAAEELNTSQSAVSRHIADLEGRLGKMLFIRDKRGLKLNGDGKRLYEAISNGLDRIHSEVEFLKGKAEEKSVTITCSHEISHLFLMPKYQELQETIGGDVKLNVLTQEYTLVGLLDSSLYDVVLTYRRHAESDLDKSNVVLFEQVRPLCSPKLYDKYKAELMKGVEAWPDLPLLDLSKPNEGWAGWMNWLDSKGVSSDRFEFKHMTNYVYLLEAAAAGEGLVLGWEGLADRYIANGTLVTLSDEIMKTDNALCGNLTDAGRNNDAAKRCLEYLVVDSD